MSEAAIAADIGDAERILEQLREAERQGASRSELVYTARHVVDELTCLLEEAPVRLAPTIHALLDAYDRLLVHVLN